MNIITMVEGVVPSANFDKLMDEYKSVSKVAPPDGLIQSTLIQDLKDPALWRIVTVWENMAKLKAMQQTAAVPAAIMVFRNSGAEPNLKVFEVKMDLKA